MKSAQSGKRWLIIIFVLVGLFVLTLLTFPYLEVYAFGPAKGWFYRSFHTPTVMRAEYIEDLDPQRAGAQVEKFLSTYRGRQGSYGLRRTVISTDGTPIGKCLVTENGTLTFVMDLTRDPDGNRQFSVGHPQSVSPERAESGTNALPSASKLAPCYMIFYIQGREITF